MFFSGTPGPILACMGPVGSNAASLGSRKYTNFLLWVMDLTADGSPAFSFFVCLLLAGRKYTRWEGSYKGGAAEPKPNRGWPHPQRGPFPGWQRAVSKKGKHCVQLRGSHRVSACKLQKGGSKETPLCHPGGGGLRKPKKREKKKTCFLFSRVENRETAMGPTKETSCWPCSKQTFKGTS